jgi:hypothetical protein
VIGKAKELDVVLLRLEVVADHSIACEEIDELQKMIVGVSLNTVCRTLFHWRTDDLPDPVLPIKLLGGNQFSIAAANNGSENTHTITMSSGCPWPTLANFDSKERCSESGLAFVEFILTRRLWRFLSVSRGEAREYKGFQFCLAYSEVEIGQCTLILRHLGVTTFLILVVSCIIRANMIPFESVDEKAVAYRIGRI